MLRYASSVPESEGSAAVSDDKYFAAIEGLMREPELLVPTGGSEIFRRLTAQAADGDYATVDAAVSDAEVDGPHGPVPIRIYRPVAGEPASPALLVWCHGGGWLGGDLDMPEADATAREVCRRSGAVVVSVDYRLALHGVHYPVPHDDVMAVSRWAADRLGDYGADRLVVGGASAGANLAAGACLRLRDEDVSVDGAVLAYPAVHALMPTASDELAEKLEHLPPAAAFAEPIFTAITENYLGAPAAEADGYAMPAVGEFVGFPRALIINCEYDGLRASGEAFAAALAAADVDVQVLLAEDVLHGHLNAPWLAQAQQSYADIARWISSSPS